MRRTLAPNIHISAPAMLCANARGRQISHLNHYTPRAATWELQHGYALGGAVEVRGGAAAPGGFETLGGPSQGRSSGPGAHHDSRTVVVALLKTCHQSLTSDGAKFVGEGPVEDQDVHSEHPLADGGGVLQDEALVDKKDATQNKGDHRSECQGHSEMSHPVIERGHSHSVREDALQTHEQQPGWERHACPHVV